MATRGDTGEEQEETKLIMLTGPREVESLPALKGHTGGVPGSGLDQPVGSNEDLWWVPVLPGGQDAAPRDRGEGVS